MEELRDLTVVEVWNFFKSKVLNLSAVCISSKGGNSKEGLQTNWMNSHFKKNFRNKQRQQGRGKKDRLAKKAALEVWQHRDNSENCQKASCVRLCKDY